MKNSITPRRGIAAVIGTAALVLAVTTGPAMGATTGDTTVTVEVSAGDLSITVPAGPVSLGAAVAGASTVSVGLGNVVVTDTRGTQATNWTASAAISDITSATTATDILKANVGYTTPAANKTGASMTVTAANRPSLTGTLAVQVVSGSTGSSTATWDPGIIVNIPGTMTPAANYEAIVTHSVA